MTNLINEELEKRGLTVKAHPCHRLDRDTSGLIIYAKGKKNQQKVMDLFHNNLINKRYFAVASGLIEKKEGSINFNIEGKNAITKYKVIKQTSDFTSLDIELLTGRTNQIRIHFKMIGHPLLGETKFAFRKDFKIKLKKLALHSRQIEFIHPITNEKLTLESSIPEEFLKFI
ncbi:MAG: hypothetical protein A2086_12060 [Spirochaetes bacterium GWD1_27_9]|nr:MAG: hypothetical protein A2Z98_03010 [Spirochaetes bacterium GWB1_27_13]OHD28965.1 MAG: hypothetical protein A2086_12060 [Spirochaetes bacterium GWD1_27_9]